MNFIFECFVNPLQFQNVAKQLKDSTIKLCRQLHENPDVAGNDKMIEKHKQKLISIIGDVIDEQEE